MTHERAITRLLNFGRETYQGVADALVAGNLRLAVRIAWLSFAVVAMVALQRVARWCRLSSQLDWIVDRLQRKGP